MSRIVDDINKLLLPRYLLNDVYPYPEGTQLEFKKTYHINQLSKYRETICAFLNAHGGHILFGITDNGVICGSVLEDGEKDKVLRYVDSIYTIMKTKNGESIPTNSLQVQFEEIAKNVFIIIISCYKIDKTEDQYQFLGGDSWIRMNASNMKLNCDKLYTVQDVLNMKSKIYKKYDLEISKHKKNYYECEQDTIVYINDILLNKYQTEKKLVKKKVYFSSYIYLILLISIILWLK
jgi:predicted HTH transcriptional regulator